MLLPFLFLPYRCLWLPCALGLTILFCPPGHPWRERLRRHDTLIIGAPLLLVLRTALDVAWWLPWLLVAAAALPARSRLRWTRLHATLATAMAWAAAWLLLAPDQRFWELPPPKAHHAAAVSVNGAAPADLPPAASRPLIVFAGDSLTSGVTPGTDDNTYVAALRRRFPAEVINAGRASDRTSDLLKRFDREVLVHQPDVIVLFIGGNDYLDGTPRTAFADAYEQVASRAAASGARLVFVEVPTGIVWDPFAGVIRRAAARHGAILVPESRLRLWFSLELVARDALAEPLTIDGIHLSPDGAVRVADWLEPYVRAALEEIADVRTPPANVISMPLKSAISGKE